MYEKEIAAAAAARSLDPALVTAIVAQESDFATDAFRFEPKFWARYLSKLPEYAGANPRRVSSSYGLMQIMYPTALEVGYDKAQPPELLFIPEVGLEFGCRRLRALVDWANGFPGVKPTVALRAALAAYNGGRGGNKPTDQPLRNGLYADQVLRRIGTPVAV